MIKERGNILFLILLAVVLFAALSYAVTSSTRGGGKDAGGEKIAAVSAQIVQYGSLLENTIMRLRTSGGCSETQLSFDNGSTATASYVNNNAPVDKHCHVFNPAGGGGYYLPVSTDWLDSAASAYTPSYGSAIITSQSRITGAGLESSGGVGEDLVLIIPYIKKELCEAINTRLGNPITLYQNGIAYDLDNANTWWHGAYGSGLVLLLYTTGAFSQPIPSPHPRTGCFLSGSGSNRPPAGYYYYYHVVMAR